MNEIIKSFEYKNKTIEIIHGDIASVKADVIVSSDDNYISMGGGVSYAIHRAAGDVVWDQSRPYIPARLGEVFVTSAGMLNAKYVFHAIVIDYSTYQFPSAQVLESATNKCLELVDHYGCKSIAFPAFGTGTGGLRSEVAAQAIIRTILGGLQTSNLQKIIFVLNRKDTLFDFMSSTIEQSIKSQFEAQLELLRIEKENLLAEVKAKSLFNRVPFPIAVTRKMTDGFSDYHSKFKSTVECGESILKYLTSIILAEYIRANPIKGQAIIKHKFSTPATLGNWYNMLDKMTDTLLKEERKSLVNELFQFYLNQGKLFFSDLVKIRNEKYGHGSTLVSELYKKDYENLIARIDLVLQQINFLEEYPLVSIEQTDILEDGYSYEMIEVVGDNPIFSSRKETFKNLRLSKKYLYILDKRNENAINLHPFLIFEICPFCQTRETFFLEQYNDEEAKYHTYRANHRIKIDPLKFKST